MRYLVRTTLAVLVGLAAVTSQAQAQQGAELGIRGGVSISDASGDVADFFDSSNITGFTGGVFLNYDMGILGFQVAGQYTQKGAELSVGDVVEDFSLDYIEIPVVIKAGIPLGIIKPSLLGGVGVGFKASCDSGGEDCGDDVKSTDFSGIFGADVAIYVGSISLWVDGRYHFSFSDVNDAADVTGDWKNRNWTFQGGVAFAL